MKHGDYLLFVSGSKVGHTESLKGVKLIVQIQRLLKNVA